MASCMCCFRCRYAPGFGTGHVQLKDLPNVKLDTSHMGNDVVIVKNGKRICGTGAALGNAPLVQNKAYYEVKVQSTGVWGVGVATRRVNLDEIPLGTDEDSWILRQDGVLYHNNEEKGKFVDVPQEGDVIGMSYDHMEFQFFLNGKSTETHFTGIKGTIYPAFYVDDGAIIDVQFVQFYHPPPSGFEEIMIEQSLL